MTIRPSAAIRQNYNEIAELCRGSADLSVGEGDSSGEIARFTEGHVHVACEIDLGHRGVLGEVV